MSKEMIEFVDEMLTEARADVSHADQKASILLAALGIGFSAVLGGQLAGGFDSSELSDAGRWAWWVGVALAVVAVACSALAVWPRYRLDDSPKYGITYWGHVAAFKDLDQLEGELDSQDTNSLRRVTHQLWRVSTVVLVKYRFVKAAIVLGAFAGLALALATIVIR